MLLETKVENNLLNKTSFKLLFVCVIPNVVNAGYNNIYLLHLRQMANGLRLVRKTNPISRDYIIHSAILNRKLVTHGRNVGHY